MQNQLKSASAAFLGLLDQNCAPIAMGLKFQRFDRTPNTFMVGSILDAIWEPSRPLYSLWGALPDFGPKK